ncbi:MAG TPA: hypothetical protein VHQ42_04035 [Candidatus Limnocylindria bacterium]|nr:hypothetical protein [Candidatus Limnocylindria bacterium]
MSHTTVVAWLALRELWISFRLLLILVAFVAGGTVATFVARGASVTLEWLALGLAVAVALTGAMAAWSMAEERRSGRAGWLAARSVGRGSIVAGWLGAFGIAALAGLVAAATLVWVAVAPLLPQLTPAGYAAAMAAIGGWCVTVVASGLVVGIALPVPLAAAVVTGAIGAGVVVAAWSWSVPEVVPGAALPLLARAAEMPALAGPALRAAGMSLAMAAVMTVIARALLERVEL